MKRLLLPVLLLAGCSSTQSPPRDDALDVAISAGRQAMDDHRPDQAIPRFEDAYRRALLHDDAGAIGDAGYDLAAAQLAAEHPKDALAVVARTRADLMPRGGRDLAGLDLVEAAALDREGREAAAAQAAARAETDADSATRARAIFLSGVIADRAGDPAALFAAERRLDLPQSDELPLWRRGDLCELHARAALARRDLAAARRQALTAAELRRTALDDRALRTALLLAARASDGLGDASAASAYRQRAAQSLAARR